MTPMQPAALLRPCIALLLLVAAAGSLQAQASAARQLRVSLDNPQQVRRQLPDAKLYVWEIIGDGEFARDSAALRELPTTLELPAAHPGVYKLGFNRYVGAEVILEAAGAAGPPLAVSLHFNSRKRQLEVLDPSPKQAVYQDFKSLQEDFNQGFNEIYRTYRYAKSSQSAPGSDPKTAYDRRVDSLARHFNARLDSFAKAHSGSYTTDYLVPLLRPVEIPEGLGDKQRKTYAQTHYLDHIDFTDPAVIYNGLLGTKLQQYVVQEMQIYGAGQLSETVDVLMRRSRGAPRVQSFLADYFLRLFGKRGPTEVLNYVHATYGGKLQDTSAAAREVLDRLERLSAGQPAPEIAMKDTSGQMRSLHESLGEKLTLIFVWQSTCSHCRKRAPEVRKLYHQYRGEGFEVFAVSVDKQADKWREGIRELGLDWINVSEVSGWQSAIVDSYAVRRTPTMVLLDSEGDILRYNLTNEQLRQFLEERLGS